MDVIQEYYEKAAKKGKKGGLNLPAMARRDNNFMSCIQADDGEVFVSRDVVALEPSITAEMSGDTRYTYATVTGIGKEPYYDGQWLMIDDIYLMSASIFPTTRDAVWDIYHNHLLVRVETDKGPELKRDSNGKSFTDWWVEDAELVKDYTKKSVRNFAKVACLGIGYGMGARKFRTTSEENGKEITYKEAKGTIEAYWEGYKGLSKLKNGLEWQVEKTGHVVNPFGYRCTPDKHKALNAYIQSSASGVLDVWCLKFFAAAKYAKFIAIIHDECVFSVPETMLDQLKLDCEAADKSLNSDLGWSVPIRWGTKIAKDFGGLK